MHSFRLRGSCPPLRPQSIAQPGARRLELFLDREEIDLDSPINCPAAPRPGTSCGIPRRAACRRPRSAFACRGTRRRAARSAPRPARELLRQQRRAMLARKVQNEVGVRPLVAALHLDQHARGGRERRVAQHRQLLRVRLAVGAAAERGIDRRGDRRAFGEELPAPFVEPHVAGSARASAPARGRARRRVSWLRATQAISSGVSGGLSESRQCSRNTSRNRIVRRVMPTGAERVEVHQAHLDVLDAALAQRVQRPLAGPDARAWAGWCRRTRSRSAAGWWRAAGSRRPARGCRSPRRADRAG